MLIAQAACAGGLFPKVVVTVAPLKPYVDEILRGLGESQNLLRVGQDAHSFALSMSQAKMLDAADVVIVPDQSMSPFLERVLAKKKKLHVIELSKLSGANPLPYAADNPWLETAKAKAKKTTAKDTLQQHDTHEHDDEEEETGPVDPHLWLDPERMAAIALPLANEIATYAPEAKPALQANAKALARHLYGQVIPALRTMLSKTPSTMSAVERPEIPFITYHAAYQYFLTRFNLTHYGEITKRPEEAMGAKTIADIISGAEHLHIRCLIGEQENVLMHSIAKSTSARLVIVSPEQLVDRKDADALDWISTDYDRLLYVTAKAFAGCL